MKLRVVNVTPSREYGALLEILDESSGKRITATAYQCVYVIVNGTQIKGLKLTYRGLCTDFQGNYVNINIKMNNKLRKQVRDYVSHS